MNVLDRITRHARLTAANYVEPKSPPFLILFINSICNQKCEHCFYWSSLNKKDDLTKDELFALSDDLGPVENLNLSGGEPFMRREFGEICRKFIRTNGVKQIYVPTNAYWTKKMVAQITETLKEPDLELFVAEFSLDGLGKFHDEFRGSPNSFKKSMESYDALAELQKHDPRLRIHANSVATAVNMEEIKRLTTFLYDRCPQMDHQNLAIIRGDRKNPSLQGPQLEQYKELYDYVRRLWAPREEERYGASVEPMLQWAKTKTVEQQAQFVPCRAGTLTGVVYANGDVSVCEEHEPLGNLRQAPFTEIWSSHEAKQRRTSIACKECWCTTEVFMWPSINYQPLHLAKAMVASKPWKKVEPLGPGEKVHVGITAEGYPEGYVTEDHEKLKALQGA
jgi:MoaA/NifB/PqqE/SkfB family radical SAM enzyme